MKPVYLEFSGINSFSETARIDFRALLSGGVFGIFGDTGSGKSTILDSIHFALYGEIDRVPKAFNDCINHRSEAAKVVFDFEIMVNGERKTYRVQRERKRKTGSSKAFLYEITGKDKMHAIAEGTREVGEKIEEIVGLSFADFKMCIALPQGDFAALVQSTPSDRVKLVARLFNLEKYGEMLSKAVNNRFFEAQKEADLIKAKMDESADCSEETIAQKQTEIQAEERLLEELNKGLEQAEARVKTLEEQGKKKREYISLKEQFEEEQTKLAQIQKLQGMLTVAPKAQKVNEKWQAMLTSERAEAQAKTAVENAQKRYEECQNNVRTQTEALQNSQYEERILQLSVLLEKLRAANADMQAAKRAEDALKACIKEYKALENKCPKEDFAGEREKWQNKLDALGQGDTFLEYLKHHYQDALLFDVYEEIQSDLRALAVKYPQTQTDVQALLAKYTAAGGGQSPDIQKLNEEFKRTEEERKRCKAQLEALETRRLAYLQNENEKALLAKQGKLLREEHQRAQEKISAVKDVGTEQDLQQKIHTIATSKKQAEERIESWKNASTQAFAEIQKQTGLQATYVAAKAEHENALKTALQEGGFASVRDAEAVLNALGDLDKAQEKTQAFMMRYTRLQTDIAQADTQAFAGYSDEEYATAKEQSIAAKNALNEVNQKLGGLKNEYAMLTQLQEKYRGWSKELAEKEKRQQVCDQLRQMVRGNRFLEFIASEYLQEISHSASKTLLSLTSGRYFLKYDKEFKVGDNLDGGNLRAVKTLSGGETFLVSLSLALSLSATVCLKSLRPIEFFFLDEGFGTLDGKLVDTVMDVLGKLSKTFAVGLISHVEELKHRIENKIVVTGATETHGSQIKMECY